MSFKSPFYFLSTFLTSALYVLAALMSLACCYKMRLFYATVKVFGGWFGSHTIVLIQHKPTYANEIVLDLSECIWFTVCRISKHCSANF